MIRAELVLIDADLCVEGVNRLEMAWSVKEGALSLSYTHHGHVRAIWAAYTNTNLRHLLGKALDRYAY